MTRRSWLAAAGSAVAVGIGGCIGRGDNGADAPDSNESGTASGTAGGGEGAAGATGDAAADSSGASSGDSGDGSSADGFGAAADSEWTTYKATSERNPVLTGTSGPDAPLELKWDHTTGPVPCVADGSVFVDDGESFYALDLETGETQWERSSDTEGRTVPLFADGTLYVMDGGPVALDPADGTEQWANRDVSDSFQVYRDGVLYGASDERAFALDTESRDVLWTAPVKSPSDPDWLTVYRLAADRKRVYVQQVSGRVTAFDREKGSEQWAIETEQFGGAVSIGFSVADGTAYVPAKGEDGPIVQAIDAATGEERWRAETAFPFGVTVTAEGVIALQAVDGNGASVFVLDPATGERRRELTAAEDALGDQPVVADGTLFHWTHDDAVRAVDIAADEIRWEYDEMTNLSDTLGDLMVAEEYLLYMNGTTLEVVGTAE